MATAASRPVVVGLTGSIGMGKSTASAWMRKAGFRVHDADATVHKLYSPGGAAVQPVCMLIPGVEAADGGIDRAKLSAALRRGEANLKDLESIVHPLVAADRNSFLDDAARDGEWLVVLDVPLLLETTDQPTRSKLVDSLIVVSAPAAVQRERVLARAGMSDDKLQFIMSQQLPDTAKRAAADHVIDTGPTSSGFHSFAPARASLAKTLMSLSHQHAAAYTSWRSSPAPCSAAPPRSGLPRVRGVSLDLDDTLFPTMPAIAAASKCCAAALEISLPRAHAAGAADTAAMQKRIRDLAASEPSLAHDYTELRRGALLSLVHAHGDPPQGAASALRTFVEARSDVARHFYDDARPAIAALRAAGLATNGNCDVTLHADVAQHFDFAVTAADVGCCKPAPVPFWFAASAAGCRPCELVHIGDDNDADLQGALDAGCRAILLTRGPTPPAASLNAIVQGALRDTARRPAADAARWREVSTLDEAVAVVLEWQRSAAQREGES